MLDQHDNCVHINELGVVFPFLITHTILELPAPVKILTCTPLVMEVDRI